MINRQILTGYIATPIRHFRGPEGERRCHFSLHHRCRRPGDPVGEEYIFRVEAMREPVVKLLTGDVRKGDFVCVEGHWVSRSAKCSSCDADRRQYALVADMVYNYTKGMEDQIGEKREQRYAKLSEEMLNARCGEEDRGYF